MNRAELDVGVGEEALGNGEQSGEIVLDKDHDPPESATWMGYGRQLKRGVRNGERSVLPKLWRRKR